MNFVKPLLAASLLCIFIACHQKSEQSVATKDMSPSNMYKILTDSQQSGTVNLIENEEQVVLNQDKQEDKKNQPDIPKKQAPAVIPDWDKKIIKTANLTLEIKDYQQYNELIRTGVKQLGGYIATEEQNESNYKIENNLVIKVPVDKFDETINKLLTGKEKVIVKKISSEDVTGEMVDVKSRMEAKRQVRLRYLDLLKQARNMEEILQVQSEINNIQVDIESAAGRVQYLTQSSAYSTIHLNFYQVLNPDANDNQKPSYGFRIVESFKNGMQWIGELLIALITLWPAWLIIGFGWMMIRKYKPFAAKKS